MQIGFKRLPASGSDRVAKLNWLPSDDGGELSALLALAAII